MGPCKDCGRQIITWLGSRCWVCTGKHIAAEAGYDIDWERDQ